MGKPEKTLRALFARPIRLNIKWGDMLTMLGHYGATVRPVGGSMFSIDLGDSTIVLHAPHPGDECKPETIRRVRQFLKDAGVEP